MSSGGSKYKNRGATGENVPKKGNRTKKKGVFLGERADVFQVPQPLVETLSPTVEGGTSPGSTAAPRQTCIPIAPFDGRKSGRTPPI